MKSNYFKSDLDYEDLLMHSVCRFDKDVKFNPLDVDNFLKLTDYIEWCITENILYTDVEAQIDALKYFYRKVENGLEVFYSVQDLMRIENSKRILKWIEKRRKKLKKTQSNNRDNLKETKTDAPPQKEYNSGQFNEHTYKLFCYIVDEYENENIVKYINIWYYLKRDIDKTKYKNILFNFTIDKYKVFIKGKYKIEIKKFKKAPYKYDEVELPILENITKTYYASLKQIENT